MIKKFNEFNPSDPFDRYWDAPYNKNYINIDDVFLVIGGELALHIDHVDRLPNTLEEFMNMYGNKDGIFTAKVNYNNFRISRKKFKNITKVDRAINMHKNNLWITLRHNNKNTKCVLIESKMINGELYLFLKEKPTKW